MDNTHTKAHNLLHLIIATCSVNIVGKSDVCNYHTAIFLVFTLPATLIDMRFQIRRLISPFLRLIRMSPTMPPTYFEFRVNEQLSVRAYLDFLAAHYEGADAGRMRTMRVTEVSLHKQMDKTSQHEYLVVQVSRPDGTIGSLIVERIPGNSPERVDQPSCKSETELVGTPDDGKRHIFSPRAPKATTSQSRDRAAVTPTSSSANIGSLDSMLKDREATDMVRFPAHGESISRDQLLGKMVFSETRPLYLYQLVTLAVAVHESQTGYRLFSNNCYWFAGTVVKVLETEYELEFEAPGQGRWRALKIYQASASDGMEGIAPGLVSDFKERVKAFENKVRTKILLCQLF